MADVVQTAANVKPGGGATYLAGGQPGIAGEALTAGNLVYKKTSDGKYYKAKANTATAPEAPAIYPPEIVLAGIALNSAAIGQAVWIQIAGAVNIGGTTVKGLFYVVSPNTAGGIAPITDLTSAQTPAHWPVTFGYAIDTAGNVQMSVLQTSISM